MWGLGKFLVGGLLGAIFGFLVSPKQAQRVRDALLGQSAAVGPVTSRALRSPEAVVVEVEPESIGVSDVADLTLHYGDYEVETFEGAAVEDEPVAGEVDVEFDESGLESAEAEPSIDPGALAPASSHDAWSSPVIPETESQEQTHLTTGWVLEPLEFEPDMDVPEFEPIVTKPEPEPTQAEPEPEPTPAEPEPEPTPAEPESEPPAAEPEPEPEPAEPEPEPTPAEPESAVAAAELTAIEVEPIESEEPAAAEMIAESEAPASVIETVVEIQADPSPVVLSDLRTRIEETRRRIQRELDQPFALDTEVPVEEHAPTFTEHEPDETEAEVATPVEYGGYAESTADEAEEVGESAAEVEAPAVGGRSAPAVPDEEEFAPAVPDEQEFAAAVPDEEGGEIGPGDDAEAESTIGEPSMTVTDAESQFDHDAMRRRIEETRNRLKAKAFDAMMKGESALLARGSDSPASTMPPQVDTGALDSEVAETIDTTLIEEDI
jgi:hypothetical protein